MHGTRPNVLATAEKELQNGAEIIPRNKQIDVTNKIPVPDEDIIPKVSLKPLRSNQTQAAKNPVGSASQVAKMFDHKCPECPSPWDPTWIQNF